MKTVYTIFKKELASFFNSLIAYIVITVFLIGVGVFFWIFDKNVLVTGKATMEDLFFFAPWFFLFLIPAITMRSFAEEMKSGTLEFLATKPITDWQIILGKYFSACFLVLFALLPTLIYYASLNYLAYPTGNLDNGPIIGAYLGLFGLGCIFASIGIFSSTLTDNQIVSFIVGAFLCFVAFAAFDFISELPSLSPINTVIEKIGINAHYRSISKGVLDTRDIVYYISFIVIVLICSKIVLTHKKG